MELTINIGFHQSSDHVLSAEKRLRRAGVALFALATAILWTSAAHAQDDQSGQDVQVRQGDEVDTIIVTARKRDESMQKVPIAISAVTGESLQDRGIENLADMGSIAPNLNMGTGSATSGSTISTQMFIRGIGQFDWLFTGDPGVGLYIDGVYHPRMVGGLMDLVDLERIEVLRGPQGTLFGKNAVGGAINVISKAPSGDFGGRVQATTGSFDRFDATGIVDFPIVEGSLYGKVSLAYRSRDGYADRLDPVTSKTRDRAGNVDRQIGRAQVRWLPNSDLTVDVNFDYTRVREQAAPNQLIALDPVGSFPPGNLTFLWNALVGFPSGTPFTTAFITGDPDTTFATGPNRSELDQWGVGGTIEWDLGAVTAKSITAYRTFDALFGRDGDGSPLPIIATQDSQDQNQFSQEIQLSGTSFDGRFDWTLGGFYMHEFGRDSNDFNVIVGSFAALEGLPGQLGPMGPTIPCAEPWVAPGCPGNPLNALLDLQWDLFSEIDIDSIAGFGQGTFAVTDRLSLTGGIRFTHEKKSLFLNSQRRNSGVPLVDNKNISKSWDELTWLGSLSYQFTPDLMSYISVSRGFKSGGFNARPTTSGEVSSFDPEYLISYEAGIKSDLFKRRLRLNTSAYYYDYKDVAILHC